MALEMKPTAMILADLGLQPGGEVFDFFVNECAERMDKYVPKREGILKDYSINGK